VATKGSLQEFGSGRARHAEVEEHDVIYVLAQALLSIGDSSQGRDPVGAGLQDGRGYGKEILVVVDDQNVELTITPCFTRRSLNGRW
jgi:hypothetical protein